MQPMAHLSVSIEKRAFFNPGTFFLILAVSIGVMFCIFIPYGAGFDEEQHEIRISDISLLHMLPNRSKNATGTYREFFSLSYQRRFFNSPASDLFSPENFYKKFDLKQRLRAQTRSIYSPVIFFPQAFVAGLFWQIFDFPILPIIILERLAGLLVYLLGAYLTLRMLPFGKWIFIILALSPMALFQAATLNADGFTNAASFLLIGLTLKIFAEKDRAIQPWQVWVLAGLALLVGMAKPGSIVLLPILLILLYRRFSSRGLLVVLLAGAILAILINLGWTAISVPNSHFSANGSQDLGRQLETIKANPLDFLITFATRNISAAGRYFRDWIGVYGYWVGVVPAPVYLFYSLALLAGLLTERPVNQFPWKIRLFMIALFLAASAAIAFEYYYLHYTPGDIASLGKQGRYFIFTAPLLYLALTGLVPLNEQIRKSVPALAGVLLIIAIGYYSFGLYATYYTECGYSIYNGESCTLPVYKNLDVQNPPVLVINTKNTMRQTFTSHCGTLEAVQVLVRSVPEDGKGTLTFSLLNEQGNMVAARDFPITTIQPGSFLELPVEMGGESMGKNAAYMIQLKSSDLGSSGGVIIALRDGSYYPDGILSLNDKKVGIDSVFLYRCPNPRLQKQ
jgi:uncharacterized membrane protein